MPDRTPEELIEEVQDRATFVAFLSALERDFVIGDNENGEEQYTYGLNPNTTGWYSGTIDAWIEASVAYAQDTETQDSNPWRECAWILLGGKSYE